MTSKHCTNCDQEKLLTEFYKRSGSSKYHNQCKQCMQQKQKQARLLRQHLNTVEKVCSECSESKPFKHFIMINDHLFHTKCNTCCNGNEFLCGGCRTIKTKEHFWIRNDTNKPRGECKVCVQSRRDDWRKENTEQYKSQAKQYRNRPEINAKNKTYQKQYYNVPANKQRKLELARVNDRNKYKNNIEFKMKKILRSRLNEMIRKNKTGKERSTTQLLGCGFNDFKRWMEYQFTAEMTWDNQGTYWDVDHIKPCASFNLVDPEHQKECFHWTNMQPLEHLENIEKSDKYTDETKFKAELMLASFNINTAILNRLN